MVFADSSALSIAAIEPWAPDLDDLASRDKRLRHPICGEIPILWHEDPANPGRMIHQLDYDYEPPLPSGAVRGDIRKQRFGPKSNGPAYYYIDRSGQCAACGAAFVFSAAEQKHWYETLGIYRRATRMRCDACRAVRRSRRLAHARLAQAIKDLARTPEDPDVHLATAAAFVELAGHTGLRRMDRAIAAARRTRATVEVSADRRRSARSYYWEARAQQIAGRPKKANAAIEEFFALAVEQPDLADLVVDARQRFAAPADQD